MAEAEAARGVDLTKTPWMLLVQVHNRELHVEGPEEDGCAGGSSQDA